MMSHTDPTASSVTHLPDGAALPGRRAVAKRAAVVNLASRLDDHGLDPDAADAIARAVVDPADARKRLERPTQVRVPGGHFSALDVMVWAPAVVPYAVNNREASARHFPAGVVPGSAEAVRFRPLRPPVEAYEGAAALQLHAESRQHLIWSLERSVQYLTDNNDLSASIAAQGVMVPVTAVVLEAAFEDGSDPVVMLGTADGSSRIAGTHRLLDLTPQDVTVRFPGDDRAFRRVLTEVQTPLDRPADQVSELEVHRLRALQLPARLLLRFEPEPGPSPVGFARAVDSLVHLVHVEPPKGWDQAGSLDAKADSVLTQLFEQGAITRNRRDYLDGMLTPDEARARKFPGEADERALEAVRYLSSEKASVKRAVRAGVLELSGGQQVSKKAKGAIAVELGLRAVRSQHSPKTMQKVRESLQDAYLLAAIWGRDVEVRCDQTLDALRDEALLELAEDGEGGKACVRLAGLGAFWLTVHRVLREARFFSSAPTNRDGRTPQRVLEALMATPWGVHVLHRAILDGRDGLDLTRVDGEGRREVSVDGRLLPMTYEWLRETVVPRPDAQGGGEGEGEKGGGEVELPTRMLLTRVGAMRTAVDRLEDAHAEVRDVKDASGTLLVEQEGINPQTVEDLRKRLDDLRTKLARYGDTWQERNEEEDDSDLDGAEGDEDVLMAEVTS